MRRKITLAFTPPKRRCTLQSITVTLRRPLLQRPSKGDGPAAASAVHPSRLGPGRVASQASPQDDGANYRARADCRMRPKRRAQCDRARQNATTCSSALFIGEDGNSASASTAMAP